MRIDVPVCACVTRTVDAGLERLPAHLACEVARAALLVEFHRDRVFVVAEETLEGRGQRFALGRCRQIHSSMRSWSL